jgi:hypothetical protein
MFAMSIETYPSETLALEVTGSLSNVSLDHLSELSLVGDTLDPGGQLRVPQKGVAAKHLAVLGSKGGSLIGCVEGEHATASLDGVPLHAVHAVSTHAH